MFSFGWDQFDASRAFAMLPSLDLYGAPGGTSDVAALRVGRFSTKWRDYMPQADLNEATGAAADRAFVDASG